MNNDITTTAHFHGKKISKFIEIWNDKTKCMELNIMFDDDTILAIEP